MFNPCVHYGIPCDAGTAGNCVCRNRFFASPVQTAGYKPVEYSKAQHAIKTETYRVVTPGDETAEPPAS